jgi:hypothetical protein
LPIDKNDLDKILDSPAAEILIKMEKGKYYSMSEISQMLVKHKLLVKDDLREYLPDEFKAERTAPIEVVLPAILAYSRDIAYVESFIWSQIAVGKLTMGFKGNEPFFTRK